jgi:hypothetical protein
VKGRGEPEAPLHLVKGNRETFFTVICFGLGPAFAAAAIIQFDDFVGEPGATGGAFWDVF